MSDQSIPAAPTRLDPWPPTWEPAAVVFDCDGMLVDTEAQWIRVQDRYLAAHNTAFDAATRREITGRSASIVIGAIARQVGKDPQEVLDELVAEHRRDLEGKLDPMPGALELLREIAERKPVAVASNSPREMLDRKIDALGLRDVVDLSIAEEDVAHPKPAPDMYREGAIRLGADPADALAFEDSETGAQAALSAGLQLIAVPSIPDQNPQAHCTLASLEDETLWVWVRTWNRTR